MIEIKDFTGGEVAGAGLFDELMRTMKAHLVAEYDANRIVGADYGIAYLGSVNAMLQTATTLLLERELRNAQILLVEEQVEGAKLDNELKEDQLLTNALQRQLLTVQVELAEKQVLQAVEQTKNITQQTAQSVKQVELLDAQILQVQAQTALTGKQEDMVDAQILTELTNTTLPTAGNAKAQYDKSLAEKALLAQKLVTEEAQTSGDVGTTEGLIKYEMQLKLNQAESFIRDAEQKAAKFYSDILAIAYSVDSTNTDPALWNIGPTESSLVFSTLLNGIGITATSKPTDPTS